MPYPFRPFALSDSPTDPLQSDLTAFLVRAGSTSPLSEHTDEEASLVIRDAFIRARLAPKEAAAAMGVSHSLLSRQLLRVDHQHVSWHRLFRLSDTFWRELWVLVAERKQLASVATQIVFPASPERSTIGGAR